MSNGPRNLLFLAPVLLAGCAADSSEGERTVFHNPYALAALDRKGIGPQCETTARASDATCLGIPLTRKGRGNMIGVPLAEGQRLTRAQRRLLRERAELLKAPRDQPAIPPALSPPPIAEPAQTP